MPGPGSTKERTLSAFTPDAARALDGPAWLQERRATAAERFTTVGLPSVDEEHWRYSRVDELDLDLYDPGASGQWSLTVGDLDRFGPRAALVQAVDGRMLGADAELAGVTVCRLTDHPEAEKLLGDVSGDGADGFAVLNEGFAPEPVVVDIAPGTVVERPILVAHQITGDGAAVFPRLIVRLGADAECTVIEWSTGGGSSLVVPIVELDVGDAARLRYLAVQELGPTTWQVATQVSRVGASATLHAASVGLGGFYARQRTDCRLEGRGSSGDLTSAYVGDGDQMLDYRTFQHHLAPDTTSNLLFKGAVGGKAASVYTGLIKVDHDAVRTRAFQTNRNLKLSDHAWAYSVPNLEIETNDVHCSHASAVGEIDSDQRFYVESRGVPPRQAERLIVRGFFRDVLGQIPVPGARPAMEDAVLGKLDEATS